MPHDSHHLHAVWGGHRLCRWRRVVGNIMEGCVVKVPVALVEAVAAAVERLSSPGIDGWGLRVCDGMAAAGEVADVSEHIGCTSDTCAHVSHDPAAPRRRWVPRSGQLVELGFDEEPGEVAVWWYAHLDGETVRYIRAEEQRSTWASAEYVDTVPDWALARLAEAK